MTEPLESIDGGKAWYYCRKGPMVLGEAPMYRASDSTLHWVDCLSEPPELHILKVDPETGDPTGEERVLELEDSVTVAFFRKNKPGSYIAAYYQGVCFLDEHWRWSRRSSRPINGTSCASTTEASMPRDASGWRRLTGRRWRMGPTNSRRAMGSRKDGCGGTIRTEVSI